MALTLGYVSGNLHKNIVLFYIVASVVTFIVYAIDKFKAQRNGWRIQESRLHLLSLIGGWAGAGLAQQWLRHKSAKKQFRIVYWITVIINLTVLLWLIRPLGSQFLQGVL